MKLRLSLLMLCALSIGAYSTHSYFTSWKWHFKQSPSLVFYSLNPNAMITTKVPRPITRIPDLVLDKAVVSDVAGKEQLIQATAQALTPPTRGSISKCFSPRHAISTADGLTVVLICFQCGQAKIVTSQSNRMTMVNRALRPTFDSLTRKHGLKAETAD